MRDIHWKLSAKVDKPVVKEPLEAVSEIALLTFDLSGTQNEVDKTLDQLAWLSDWLLSNGVNHDIRWIDPAASKPMSFSVNDNEDFYALMVSLLKSHLSDNTQKISTRLFPSTGWKYHISPFARDDADR
jgi:uncharacterized protein (DUF58 family)